MGVIEPARSAYSSPIVLVRKKDQTHRFCIDFRRLNKVTEFEVEPLPDSEYIYAKVAKARYFTKIDLSKGYWQVPLSLHYTRCDIPVAGNAIWGPKCIKRIFSHDVEVAWTFHRQARLQLHGRLADSNWDLARAFWTAGSRNEALKGNWLDRMPNQIQGGILAHWLSGTYVDPGQTSSWRRQDQAIEGCTTIYDQDGGEVLS